MGNRDFMSYSSLVQYTNSKRFLPAFSYAYIEFSTVKRQGIVLCAHHSKLNSGVPRP
jgi:hypothetical protein